MRNIKRKKMPVLIKRSNVYSPTKKKGKDNGVENSICGGGSGQQITRGLDELTPHKPTEARK